MVCVKIQVQPCERPYIPRKNNVLGENNKNFEQHLKTSFSLLEYHTLISLIPWEHENWLDPYSNEEKRYRPSRKRNTQKYSSKSYEIPKIEKLHSNEYNFLLRSQNYASFVAFEWGLKDLQFCKSCVT